METLQDRKEWQEIFQVIKTRGMQLKLLYPAKPSIKMEGQIRSFPGKRSFKEYTSSKTRTARDAKGTALRKGRKSDRERNTGMKEVKWQ